MLTDINDPVFWSTIIQTIVLTLTLLIFALSFRSQDKVAKESAYQKVLDDTTDAMKMLLTNPELGRIQTEMARVFSPASRLASLTQEELAVRAYLSLLYGIFERAYLLYCRKWIDKEAWSQFDTWLQRMMTHPMFVEVHRFSTGMYDKPFQDYIDGLLDKDHRKRESPNP